MHGWCFLSWLLPLPLQAKPLEMELKAEGLYVSNPSTAVLQRMFDDYGYRDYIYMPDWKYPPLFLNALPSDFNRVADKNLRNRLFIQILAPLINAGQRTDHFGTLSADDHLIRRLTSTIIPPILAALNEVIDCSCHYILKNDINLPVRVAIRTNTCRIEGYQKTFQTKQERPLYRDAV